MPTTVSETRARYEAIRRNQATMQQVTTLLERESTKVLGVARDFDRQELGGFLRSAVPGLIDRYGQVNAVAAMKYYNEQRDLHLLKTGLRDYRRGSQRIAAAKLRSQIYVASLPEFNTPAIAEPIIGWGMARFADEGFEAMESAVRSSMTRAVGSFNRDTIIYNAGLDDAVVGVQRVAEPTACSFCALIAFGSGQFYSRESRVSNYAVEYHDHCHCSIETLYEGDEPFRPDYYDTFEAAYNDATEEAGTTDTKEILAAMRRNSGLK